ncbi:DUF3658 domain-containing protein [Niallia circulans]|uniref:DUF3658 domain-containing protein n=1 Tax=Niallia circulans TaxID=1397 RepID=UPI0026EAA0B7|nr:DUF3658 domain-containing protein [Niallia circulans]
MKHKKAIHLVASPYIASRLAVDLQGNKEKTDYIRTSQLIWRTIEEEHLYMDPDFLEYRIRYLVYSGALEMKEISKNRRRYYVCLKKMSEALSCYFKSSM